MSLSRKIQKPKATTTGFGAGPASLAATSGRTSERATATFMA
jgi:hypothetical protein